MVDLLQIGVAGLIIGVPMFIAGIKTMKTKRLVENIPTSKIRSLAMGLAEIYGEVGIAMKNVLKSPFTGKNCIYYKYQVDEYRRSKNRSYWKTIKNGTKGVPFYVKDNTGKVLVDPTGAWVDIPKDTTLHSGIGKDPPKEVMNFLNKEKISFEGWFGINKKMRYIEYFIQPKEEVYVLGSAGDNPYVEEATAQSNVEDIMMQKGKNEKFYYISDKREKKLLKKMKRDLMIGLGGGSLLIVGGLAAIFISLGMF